MTKTLFCFVAVSAALLVGSLAQAEISSHAIVQGTVTNFTATTVVLEIKGGARIQIPRAGVQDRENLKPGTFVSAAVDLDDVKPVAASH